ncbi:replication initiator protein, partial [Corchorus golden mosaic virus [Bangladesh:Bogra:2013]]
DEPFFDTADQASTSPLEESNSS